MTRASTTRLEAFSDGVFAIAITLLIFGIRVPVIVGPEISEELKRQLLSLWPGYLSFAVSFTMIGIFWIAHHHMFRLIARSTRPLLWLNKAFLMCVSFLPFPTAILGLYGKQRISVILYCATLMIAAVALYILWIYASSVGKLLYSGVSPRVVRVVGRRILGGCLLYGVRAVICEFDGKSRVSCPDPVLLLHAEFCGSLHRRRLLVNVTQQIPGKYLDVAGVPAVVDEMRRTSRS